MTRYEVYGTGPSLMDSNTPGSVAGRLMYVSPTEFGIQNADGTRTYFLGTNISYDPDDIGTWAGQITAIVHYDADGRYIDSLSGLTDFDIFMANVFLVVGYESTSAPYRDTVIDARVRANGAVIDDKLSGGFGNDTVYGGTGDDRLDGGGGNDKLYGMAGHDVLLGDSSIYWTGNDLLNGGGGSDVLWGSLGSDTLDGSAGTDTAAFAGRFASLKITKTATGFTVVSNQGTDTLRNIERIAADDGIYAWDETAQRWSKVANTAGMSLVFENATFTGTAAADTQTFGPADGTRVVYGLGGDDSFAFTGGIGEVAVFGGAGNDTVATTTGEAYLNGGTGNDSLTGSGVADDIIGGWGDDTINGGPGDSSNDKLSGGAGADTFRFEIRNTPGPYDTTYQLGWGDDVITDFVVGTDRLDLGIFAEEAMVTDTAQGTVVEVTLKGWLITPVPTTSILLKGVHGVTSIDDLIA